VPGDVIRRDAALLSVERLAAAVPRQGKPTQRNVAATPRS